MTVACKICAKNNFPNEQINLEQVGNDPATGKAKWKVSNPDGTAHTHKGDRPKVALAPILTEKLDKVITLLERISGQLAQK